MALVLVLVLLTLTTVLLIPITLMEQQLLLPPLLLTPTLASHIHMEVLVEQALVAVALVQLHQAPRQALVDLVILAPVAKIAAAAPGKPVAEKTTD